MSDKSVAHYSHKKYIYLNYIIYQTVAKNKLRNFEKTLAISLIFCYYNKVRKIICNFKEVQTHGKM